MPYSESAGTDDPSLWPTHPMVRLMLAEADRRGAVQPLVNQTMGHVGLLSSVKGSLRGNHFHRTNWHYCYVMTGAFDYWHRPAGSTESPAHLKVGTSEMVFTPPLEEHAMVFTEDTLMLVMHRNRRDKGYSGDDYAAALVETDGLIV